jgi:hypothetical protein
MSKTNAKRFNLPSDRGEMKNENNEMPFPLLIVKSLKH